MKIIWANLLISVTSLHTSVVKFLIFRCLHLLRSKHLNNPQTTHDIWTWSLKCWEKWRFLGGLSLHLNHLIASRMTNYDWPFGTLPFGLFWSNLDTMDLETYPRTYSGHFWHMSLFDDFRAVWVFSKNGCSQKIKVFSMKERSLRGFVIQFSWAKCLG